MSTSAVLLTAIQSQFKFFYSQKIFTPIILGQKNYLLWFKVTFLLEPCISGISWVCSSANPLETAVPSTHTSWRAHAIHQQLSTRFPLVPLPNIYWVLWVGPCDNPGIQRLTRKRDPALEWLMVFSFSLCLVQSFFLIPVPAWCMAHAWQKVCWTEWSEMSLSIILLP